MKKTTNRSEIAAALQEIGTLLELKAGDRFKARAYKHGARIIAELPQDLGTLIRQDRLTFIPGIGHTLAKQIQELHLTGQSSLLNELRTQYPSGTAELSGVPGLSVEKIERLQAVLGISSIEDLKAACLAGKVRVLKGFGAKTEEKLLDAIVRSEGAGHLLHLHQAYSSAQRILEYLETTPTFRGEVGGSLRRWQETVSLVVIVASAKRPRDLIDHFLRFPLLARINEQDETRCDVDLTDGTRALVIATRPADHATVLLRATGSAAHLQKLEFVASYRKLEFTDQGLHRIAAPRASKTVRAKSKAKPRALPVDHEEDIYRQLGMQYVPPELREDTGEVEAALTGELPEDLVTLDDIRGMVHCHTTYSDGKNTIEEMAHAAAALGMKYLTITDHSPTAFYARGVKIDRLQQQWEEIDRVQEQCKIKILKGTESDITIDGSLDYPDWVLEQFDIIIASIHSRYKMNADQMTRRIITAMQQPVFKIWGHALGRRILQRPPFDCCVEEILDVIAASGAAIEINGDPHRLDMEPRWLREARRRKIKFVISVDAHSTQAMNYLMFGVGTARRGWVRRNEVLNTLGAKAFQKAVKPMPSQIREVRENAPA